MLKVLLGLFLFLAAGPARAADPTLLNLLDPPVSYSADYHLVTGEGRWSGRTWHAPGRQRWDFTTPLGLQSAILGRDGGTALMLLPEREWYVAFSLASVLTLAGGGEQQVQRRQLGTPRIAGRPVTRWAVTATAAKGGGFSGEIWSDGDGIILRLKGDLTLHGRSGPVEMELSRLRPGPVDPDLFAIPPGWSGLDMTSLPPAAVAGMVASLRRLAPATGGH